MIGLAHLSRVYLSLGSNLGNRKAYLKQAVQALSNLPDTRLDRVSSLYETPPWGLIEQPAFLNLCIGIDTSLTPQRLLKFCLDIEKEARRERNIRWGPRVLDIDILTYGNVKLEEHGLTLPHPSMLERAFVLMPLAEIAPDMHFDGINITNALSKLDTAGIANIGALNL